MLGIGEHMRQDDAASAGLPAQLRRWLPLLVLVAVPVLVVAMGWHRYLSFETIGRNYDGLRVFISANFLAALATYMALYIVIVALSIPGGLFLTLAGGLLFGWQVGGPAAVISATIGAAIVFLIVKSSFGSTLAARAGPFVAALREGFAENALSYLLFLRLVPVFPFFAVNLVPALLGVPLTTFLIGTLIGIIPGTLAYSLAGSGLGSVVEAQNEIYRVCVAKAASAAACPYTIDLSALVTRELLAAFAALGFVALIPVAIKFWSKRNATS